MLITEPPSEKAKAEELDRQALGRAIGKLTSGVYVLTLKRGEELEGILMTWVGQAAFEPPMISMAIKNDRPLLGHLSLGSSFVLNVLSKNNMDIFKNFAKPHITATERFAGLSVKDNGDFGPVFTSALSYLNCSVSKIVEAGDHHLIIAEVAAGEVLDTDSEPMSHVRKNGFQY